ncbi:MAG: group 1 truncated hemoglobin [Pirellulaceae bacterium]
MTTLFEKIGKRPGIERLVGAFYHRVLADPLLSPFFEETSIEKLKEMQIAFFTIALGGPEPPLEVSLYESHRGKGIRRKHLTRFVEHLVATLAEIGVEPEDAKRIYERIGTYSDEVLGDASVDG